MHVKLLYLSLLYGKYSINVSVTTIKIILTNKRGDMP